MVSCAECDIATCSLLLNASAKIESYLLMLLCVVIAVVSVKRTSVYSVADREACFCRPNMSFVLCCSNNLMTVIYR